MTARERVSAPGDPISANEPVWFQIRVRGLLGSTTLEAFPTLTARRHGTDTVLRGPIEDQAALHGQIAQIEALGLELIEVRRLRRD